MILYLLFSLFISAINANIIQNDYCFKIVENYVLNQTTLQINGTGRMCDCNADELKEYHDSINLILFEDSVTSIGSQCFMNFEKM